MIKNKNPKSDFNQMTLLFAADGRKLAKRFYADGQEESYDRAYLFKSASVAINNIDDLFNIVQSVSEHPDRHIGIVRGTLCAHIEADQMHRRTSDNYQDVARSWALFDIDDLSLPPDISPISEEAVLFALKKMPACFQDRDCVYHFSSKAGRVGQVFKGHLAFLLEKPLDSPTLRSWVRDYVNQDDELVRLDPALFNPVQIHYIANPIFEDSTMDPFAGRSRVGLIRGLQRYVPVASILDPPKPVMLVPMSHRANVRHRYGGDVRVSWEAALNEIHEDRLGLHQGILHVITHAVRACGTEVDRSVVKQAIRERVHQAVADNALRRDPDYIQSEMRDDRLERAFDWAINRGYAIQFIKRSNNPTFSKALLQLESEVANKTGKHSIEDLVFTAASIGFYQCPSRFGFDEMLSVVQQTCQHRLRGGAWEVIENRLRKRYVQLVQSTLSTRKILRHSTISIQSLGEIDTTQPGIHLVKAPMGSGKTEVVAGGIVAQSNKRGCVINHRISLSADLANRLGLDYYKSASQGSDVGVATCVNSITQQDIQEKLNKASAVVVDEFSQTLDHLVIGPVDHRSRVFREFKRLMQDKDIVVLLDADLNDRDIDWVEETVQSKKDIFVYEMSESWADYELRILPSSDSLIMRLCDDLLAGEKVMLAVDSKNSAERCSLQIVEQIKLRASDLAESLRILTVHSDNSGGEQQVKFLTKPDDESVNYDLLIYSPSISSGVSLKRGHFTQVYGLYHGIVSGREFFQMLRRNRTVKSLSLAYRAVSGKSRLEKAEDRLRGYRELAEDMGLSLLEEDSISALKVNVEYQQELQRQNAFNRLVILAEDMGYQIVREQVVASEELADCDFDPQHREQIKAAANLSEHEFERLTRKNLKTQEESYQIKRAHLQRGLGLGEESPSDEDFDYVKQFRLGAPRQFELLRSNEEENREFMQGLPSAEIRSLAETRKHRIKILEILGLDTVDFSGTFDQEKLKDAVRYLIEDSAKLNRLNMTTKIAPITLDGIVDVESTLRDYKPKAIIQEFFRKLGLTVERSGTSAKYRRYMVSQDSLERTWNYVAARGNIQLTRDFSVRQLVGRSPELAVNAEAFVVDDSSNAIIRCLHLMNTAEQVHGTKGLRFIELIGNQQTVPLSTSWVGAHLRLKDPKTIRDWSETWSDIHFEGLYRYEYKPVGIRGPGGRKQYALSLEKDSDQVKNHLQRLLSIQVEHVRTAEIPAHINSLDSFVFQDQCDRTARPRPEALAA